MSTFCTALLCFQTAIRTLSCLPAHCIALTWNFIYYTVRLSDQVDLLHMKAVTLTLTVGTNFDVQPLTDLRNFFHRCLVHKELHTHLHIFVYINFYEQLEGMAMGSPLFPVVASIIYIAVHHLSYGQKVVMLGGLHFHSLLWYFD